MAGQVTQPPLMLIQRGAVTASRDTGALDAQGPQQVADRVRGEDRAALGRPEALGVEPLRDLRDGESAVGQFAGPRGQLGIVAELSQAGHRPGDLRGGAVPARPDDLHVRLLALATAYVLADSLAPPQARNRAGNWVNSGYNAGNSAGALLSGQLVGRIPLSACLPVLAAPALLALIRLLRTRLTPTAEQPAPPAAETAISDQ